MSAKIQRNDTATEFEKFEYLAKRLVAVPHKEVAQKRESERKEKAKKPK